MAEKATTETDTDWTKFSFTAPQCERCWVERNATTETMADGHTVVSIRRPSRLTSPDAETCSFCGNVTIVGIFVRADPRTVPYPRLKSEDD